LTKSDFILTDLTTPSRAVWRVERCWYCWCHHQ